MANIEKATRESQLGSLEFSSVLGNRDLSSILELPVHNLCFAKLPRKSFSYYHKKYMKVLFHSTETFHFLFEDS